MKVPPAASVNSKPAGGKKSGGGAGGGKDKPGQGNIMSFFGKKPGAK